MFDKQTFFAAAKVRRQKITLPGILGLVYVYEMTGLEHDQFDADTFSVGSDGKATFARADYRARLVIACLRDGNGVPLFVPADLAAVSALGTSILDKVGDVARKLNALTDADVAAEAKN
jgi:hypothetical protein